MNAVALLDILVMGQIASVLNLVMGMHLGLSTLTVTSRRLVPMVTLASTLASAMKVMLALASNV